MDKETFLTVREVAEMLRVHPATVRAAIKRGDIPATRFGRKWLIRAADIAPVVATPPK
jgi:excisionase family DNA binding protein